MLIAICLLCFMTACGPGGKSYRIHGTIAGMKTGELYIYQQSDDNARFDTIQVKDGTFRYAGEVSGTTPVFLFFPNALEQVIFVGGGQSIEYQAEANKLQDYTADGNEDNKLLNELRKNILGKDTKQTTTACAQFIRKNKHTAAAVYVFQRYFLQDENTPISQLKDLLSLLRKQQPNNRQLLADEGYVRQLQAGRPNSSMPKLKLHLAGNHTVDLRHPDKDYMVLCFWATWMQNSWEYNTTIQDILQRYGQQITVVNLSLDTQIFKWQEYIGTDTLTHLHYCDGMSWDNKVVKALGVRNIPTYFIVDHQGIIRKRGTDLGTLQRNLSELLP